MRIQDIATEIADVIEAAHHFMDVAHDDSIANIYEDRLRLRLFVLEARVAHLTKIQGRKGAGR